jgi:hypothetical protein
MGERMGRIGRIQTDFFNFLFKNQAELKEKSVSIRPIRSPIVSLFSKQEITDEAYFLISKT